MTNKQLKQDKNYYLSFVNIKRACFCMLNNNIADQFKVSNTPNMTGWNPSMRIHSTTKKLETLYGKPDKMLLFHNDVLLCRPFPATKAPEMLFYHIKQCQEIQTVALDPYTPKQIIGNAVCLLMQSRIFPLKKFHMWEAMTVKLYPILKKFIHEAYSRRLTSIQLGNTADQQGYVHQNMYNILNEEDNNNTDDNTTVVTQTVAAATTVVLV
jgi:hypothetical protein